MSQTNSIDKVKALPFVLKMEKNEIPITMPLAEISYGKGKFNIDSLLIKSYARSYCIKRGMYAFVSKDWIKPLAKWIGERKVLEVMAGAGWLSKALDEEGVNIISTDNYSWKNCTKQQIYNIEHYDASKAIAKYGKDVDIVIMSWPYMNNLAYRLIKKCYLVNKNIKVIYIGEDFGGCTANDNFFNSFEIENDKNFNLVNKKFKSWLGIHDKLYLGKYKKNK